MFLIEGNIGVGKSTLCSLLQTKRPSYQTITEPVKQWHNEEEGPSLLERFYQDPYRWGYTIETLTMINRIKEYYAHTKDKTKITIFERSLYSGYHCFAQNGKNKGFLNTIEWNIYTEWTQFLLQNSNLKPNGFIYLRASPETCHARINKRLRSGESNISLTYLTDIHNLHDDFLYKKTENTLLKSVPVLIIDAEKDFALDEKNVHDLIDQIDVFINQNKNV